VFCTKCGAAITSDAAFCRSCGASVGGVAVAVAGEAPAMVSPHAGVGAIAYATKVVYAGFWLRFLAYLVDHVILGIATVVVCVPLFFLLGGAAYIEAMREHGFENPGPAQIVPLILIGTAIAGAAIVLNWLYFAYLESGEKQATWGKQALSIYVTDLEGRRISFGRATARFFAKIVSGLVPLWIGFIMAGFTERKQALHDMIAGTLVLRR